MNSTIKSLLLVSLLILASFLSLESCKKDVTAKPAPKVFVCDTTTISFATDVLPIFQQNCSTSGCHDAATNTNGFTFENYTQISGGINYAIDLMKHTTGFIQMPYQLDKLHDTLIDKIDCWIAAGVPNN